MTSVRPSDDLCDVSACERPPAQCARLRSAHAGARASTKVWLFFDHFFSLPSNRAVRSPPQAAAGRNRSQPVATGRNRSQPVATRKSQHLCDLLQLAYNDILAFSQTALSAAAGCSGRNSQPVATRTTSRLATRTYEYVHMCMYVPGHVLVRHRAAWAPLLDSGQALALQSAWARTSQPVGSNPRTVAHRVLLTGSTMHCGLCSSVHSAVRRIANKTALSLSFDQQDQEQQPAATCSNMTASLLCACRMSEI